MTSAAEEIVEIKRSFRVLDNNGDGRLTKKEFAQVFLGQGSGWSQADVDDLMAAADKNGDGSISYEEFIDWVMRGDGASDMKTAASKLGEASIGKDGLLPLKVQIKSCTGLRNADLVGKSDPFCIVSKEGTESSLLQTDVQWNTVDPVWNFEGTLENYKVTDVLVITIMDKDSEGQFQSKDDLLGTVKLTATQIVDKLYKEKAELSGEVKEFAVIGGGKGKSPRLKCAFLPATVEAKKLTHVPPKTTMQAKPAAVEPNKLAKAQPKTAMQKKTDAAASKTPIQNLEASQKMGAEPDVKENIMEESDIEKALNELLRDYPYLDPSVGSVKSHPMHYWVRKIRENLKEGDNEEAQEHLDVVQRHADASQAELRAAFNRFDTDSSGEISKKELEFLCAFLGLEKDEAKLIDSNQDDMVTYDEFDKYVGKAGGLRKLYEKHRERVSMKQFGNRGSAIRIGNRVQSYCYIQGKKSSSVKEAQVLAVNVKGKCEDAMQDGVMLSFGFSRGRRFTRKKEDPWDARQVVPPSWIVTSATEAEYCDTLREIGILGTDQSFWASIFPPSELEALGKLTDCQRAALRHVRQQATANHQKALPAVREKFVSLGYGEKDLQNVFTWIEDLAPCCVHVHIDKVGRFMKTDDFYRNQFETKTSCGALDDGNQTRKRWEKDLFGDTYANSTAFERPKYGALSVMNDPRGIVSASQYGDSYMVLKDVRLRCTFAATDSGGISGSRLAVLDKYAHVLNEYNDTEIHGIVKVANANMDPQNIGGMSPDVLRGSTVDSTREWITIGFPDLAHSTGRFYFEVRLEAGCIAPQVGVASLKFEREKGKSVKGVGDDEHSWSVDGLHAARWHNGMAAWSQSWASEFVASRMDPYGSYGMRSPFGSYGSQGNSMALLEATIVGIGVDFDAGQLWFATNGVWDSEPTFENIPSGIELYPAMSLMGNGSFTFGPKFAHEPRIKDVVSFERWPGAPDGSASCTNPAIGNSEILRIYKEIQIHGEVNWKRNVQRLVATTRYREFPKQQRTWSVEVVGELCPGIYQRSGAIGKMPIYRHVQKTGAVIYHHEGTQCWRLNDTEDMSKFIAFAPAPDGDTVPPRIGWRMPDEQMGIVDADIFNAVLSKHGVDKATINKLSDILVGPDQGGNLVAFRFKDKASWKDEWEKMKDGSSKTADEIWDAMVKWSQKCFLDKLGFTSAVVFDNGSHPYPAKKHTWQQDVSIQGAAAMTVHFATQCCTFGYGHEFSIMPGSLTKESAVEGAPVSISALGQQVPGRILNMVEGSDTAWLVALDEEGLSRLGFSPPTDFTDAEELKHRIVVSGCGDVGYDGEYTFDVERTKARNENGLGHYKAYSKSSDTSYCLERSNKKKGSWGFCRNSGPFAYWAQSNDLLPPTSGWAAGKRGTEPVGTSRYNREYYCTVRDFKWEGEDLIISFEAVGDGSCGNLQDPLSSEVFCEDTDRETRASEIEHEENDSTKRIAGKLVFKNVAKSENLFFTYGSDGYDEVQLLQDEDDGVEPLPMITIDQGRAEATVEEAKKCPNGHVLVCNAGGADTRCGWGCDGRGTAGGCLGSLNGYGGKDGLDRFTCLDCNFDLCVACFTGRKPKKTVVTCNALVNQKEVKVTYTNGKKASDEIKHTKLDMDAMLTPVTITDFSAPGPAQEAGVREGWYLDIFKFCQEQPYLEVDGQPLVHYLMNGRPSASKLQKALDAILGKSDLSIPFSNGLSVMPIPCAKVYYDANTKVGTEFQRFTASRYGMEGKLMFRFKSDDDSEDDGTTPDEIMKSAPGELKHSSHPCTLKKMSSVYDGEYGCDLCGRDGEGWVYHCDRCGWDAHPKCVGIKAEKQNSQKEVKLAREAGVRADQWVLEADTTLSNLNEGNKPRLTKEDLANNPNKLLEMADVNLFFTPLDCCSFYRAQGPRGIDYGRCGVEAWTNITIPGNSATFKLIIDGYDMGQRSPEQRWGIFGLVVDAGANQLTQDVVDELAKKMIALTTKATGYNSSSFVVEYEDWDEHRLLALCKEKGWEFEWMSDDGERQRRIGQRAAIAQKMEARELEMKSQVAAAVKELPDGTTRLAERLGRRADARKSHYARTRRAAEQASRT